MSKISQKELLIRHDEKLDNLAKALNDLNEKLEKALPAVIRNSNSIKWIKAVGTTCLAAIGGFAVYLLEIIK